jgi:hypothetical protein
VAAPSTGDLAVTPALQEVNQTKLVQSTIGVLTNVREDHLQEMGSTLVDVARSLARPCRSAGRDLLHALREEARRPVFVLVNCRPDRIERNGQMGKIVPWSRCAPVSSCSPASCSTSCRGHGGSALSWAR